MSLYKRPGQAAYSYDFVVRGHRFSGTTGKSTQREAQLVEDEERARAKDSLKKAKATRNGPMTINIACDRYWLEVAQHNKRPDGAEWSLAYLIAQFGPNKLLRDISDSDVAEIVARRRADPARNHLADKGRAKRRKQGELAPEPIKRVSPARVNRSVTEPLRRVLNRARDLWGQEVQHIRWKQHILAEPEELVREITREEEAKVLAVLPLVYHPPVIYALRQGERLSACAALRIDGINWENGTAIRRGKGDRVLVTPIAADVFAMLKLCRGRNKERVFAHDNGEAITAIGLARAWTKALKRAGVRHYRFHDIRHTAGTRLLRATGNLKMTQKLLGHRDIRSTMRYAHVLDSDLRDALDALPGAAFPTEIPTVAAKPMKRKV